MNKYCIERRTISAAIYQKHNPTGDPFTVKPVKTREQARLMGLGLGLYWGEGNKVNKHSVRLGNTDPELIKVFACVSCKTIWDPTGKVTLWAPALL